MTVFFTSDTHFGDHRTLNIHKRAFASVAEMDAVMVERWNAAVSPEDTVWHLGDVARGPAQLDLVAQLHGTKHLIRGNNDPEAVAQASLWASVADYAELELDGHSLVLCHYPFRSWNGQHKRAINLHGHSHGRLKPMPRQFDVGVDVHGFTPVTLTVLLARY
jgi:calcineurin-like phosphoesterase family protein